MKEVPTTKPFPWIWMVLAIVFGVLTAVTIPFAGTTEILLCAIPAVILQVIFWGMLVRWISYS